MNIRFRTTIAVLGIAAMTLTSISALAQTGTHDTSNAVTKPPRDKDKDKGGDPPRVTKPPKDKDKDKGGDPPR